MSNEKSSVPDIFKGFENHNQLLPTKTYYGNLGPMQKVSVEEVTISPDPNAGDVYKLRAGQLPLTKRALEKIAHAAGVSFHPEFSRVEEHRSGYCRYKAVGAMKKADGTLQVVTGTYFIDLEEDKKAGMSDDRLAERRRFIVQLCESGAKNRAIRSLLGLKSHYTPEELKRPFAVPRIDFSPDLSDPTVKQFLLAQATGAVHQLYPPTPAASSVVDAPPALPPGEEVTTEAGDDLGDLDTPADTETQDIEDKITTFKAMDGAQQGKTFAELVNRLGANIGTKEKPKELRVKWGTDRVGAYRELLERGAA